MPIFVIFRPQIVGKILELVLSPIHRLLPECDSGSGKYQSLSTFVRLVRNLPGVGAPGNYIALGRVRVRGEERVME